MKRTAALHTFVTAWILLAVAGLLFFADQQKRVAISGQNPMESGMASLADDTTDYRQIDRDEKMLGVMGVIAGGILATSLILYRTKTSQPAPVQVAKKAA